VHPFKRHQQDAKAIGQERSSELPGSSVRVLHSDEELRDALKRATASEQLIMTRAAARTSRYSRLTPETPAGSTEVSGVREKLGGGASV
jgi:hypothetical protein